MEFTIIMAIATFLNFALLKWKLDKERYADLLLDISVLIALGYLFKGSMAGMSIAMSAGALMSIYLAIFPPKFMNNFSEEI